MHHQFIAQFIFLHFIYTLIQSNKMKPIIVLLYLLITVAGQAQITLKHNVGNTIIETSMFSCTSGELKWGRTFTIEDFGVPSGESFTIASGKIGIAEASNFGLTLRFNIYQIDNNFPTSFSTSSLIGSSQIQEIPYLGDNPEIIQIQFLTPVIIPENVEKILVEVEVGDIYNSITRYILPGGTLQDADFSWFKSSAACATATYKTTQELGHPDARFYITVSEATNLDTPTLNGSNTTIKASPNPVKDFMEVTATTPIDKIKLYTTGGQLIYEENNLGLHSKTINYSSFPSGIYFLQVMGDNKITALKTIKR